MMVKEEEEKQQQQDLAFPPMTPFDDYYHHEGDEYEDYEEEEEETDSEDERRTGEPQLKKGPWTPDEDRRLRDYVQRNGEGNWNQVRINAGLNRCGKSCRLRWSNHLRPDLKKGPFEQKEIDLILEMHYKMGNKWAQMAKQLPGRTDNEIKNFWNTRLKRCQRNNLPIYPESLVLQAKNQDMNFGTPEASCGTTRPNESSQSVLGIGNLANEYFNSFDLNTFCAKYVPMTDMADLPCPSLVGPNSLTDAMNYFKQPKPFGCIASEYNGSHSSVQTPDESEVGASYFGMTDNQLAQLGTAIGHPMFDGNPSISWTALRPMKTELPSVQNTNHGFSNNAWVGSYPSVSIEQADNLPESPLSLKSETNSSQNTSLDVMGVVDPTDPTQCQGVLPPFPYNQQTNVYSTRSSFPSLIGGDLGEVQASNLPSSGPSSWTKVGTHDASIEANLSYHGPMYDEAQLLTAARGLAPFAWNGPDFSDL